MRSKKQKKTFYIDCHTLKLECDRNATTKLSKTKHKTNTKYVDHLNNTKILQQHGCPILVNVGI